jgi:hypothetical protein
MTGEILAVKGGTVGEKGLPVISLHGISIHAIRDFLHAANLQQLYFPSKGRCAEDFFALKNPTAWVGFVPATPRPLKLLFTNCG